MQAVRPTAVAGTFYPAEPARLSQSLRGLLAAVQSPAAQPVPKVLIAPHAGYIYSGSTAARAYARLTPAATQISRVVLIGPAHRVALRGLALPGVERFASPLGEIEIDQEAVRLLSDMPQIIVSPDAHAQEHSLEVHLPFLQAVLGEFKLLPLVAGHANADEVAQVIERLWGGPETLIVISSDLSHFLPYDAAQHKDSDSVQRILSIQPGLDHSQACGATPVNGLLVLAQRKRLRSELLGFCNSGDTAGDKARVVGYASIGFFEQENQTMTSAPTDADGHTLLTIARNALAAHFGQPWQQPTTAAWMNQAGASFVTLTLDGNLRGCIGSLKAWRPLLDDVRENALAAALRDTRFAPLSLAEFLRVRVEVSLLTPAEPMAVSSEADALAQLRPGQDGVILEYGAQRGTFLPQVWESLPQAQDFLNQLKRKAGLATDFWHPDIRLSRYAVKKWKEAERA